MEEFNDSLKFTRRVIIGKIAEVIFRQMFTHNHEFEVVPLGFEYKFPELLAHYNKPHREIIEKVSAQLRSAPDFLLLSNHHDNIFLVEVKYHTGLVSERLLEESKRISEKWDFAWLFIATPAGFYFDSCIEIIEHQGEIAPLGKRWPSISEKLMQQYLQILNQYIKPVEGSEDVDVHRYFPEDDTNTMV